MVNNGVITVNLKLLKLICENDLYYILALIYISVCAWWLGIGIGYIWLQTL